MRFDDDALEHLADLARLDLAGADRAALALDLERLVGYLAHLQTVDVEGVAPMTRPFDEAGGALRDDEPRSVPSPAAAALAELAPAVQGGRIRVARTVDDAG